MKKYLPHMMAFFTGLLFSPALFLVFYEVEMKENGAIVLEYKNPVVSLRESLTKNEGSETAHHTCARNRWILKSALLSAQKDGVNEKTLNIFALLSKGYLKEVPNCPGGGTYQLKDHKTKTVGCSVHGVTR